MNIRLDPDTLVALVLHFGGCAQCCEDHGSYPESVSCYCHCHDGAEARWEESLKYARLALTELEARQNRD